MANNKSAEKRARQNERRHMHNRMFESRARTAVKKARQLIDAGDPGALEAVHVAYKALDKAANKGAIHENNAARRKSRLAVSLNKSQDGENDQG
jgi:small subunit ribosomal protein S20